MNSLSQRTGLSGSALKWIAIVTMLIDHIGATLVWNWYLECFSPAAAGVYALMRIVGRAAFPVFCFLLVEGFCHTGSRKNYAIRLGLFCLIAELPFDLAVWEEVPCWTGQNVFFTLLLGFLTIWCSEMMAERTLWHPALITGAMVLLFGRAAEYLQTDYGFFGVLLIGALYLGRKLDADGGKLRLLLGSLAILWYCWSYNNWVEIFAVVGLGLTMLYNGRRGNGPKWFFYWFYPLHLSVLGVLNCLLF